ncbi:bifunctional sugar phosphate isomerase/epimerase/4-hydroxyphenylpyruvate dioxygenase family protein [Phaeovulum sp.]|uniref:bifunctional sugar phosphate isomerase/epimerase/4-hydroxyphenylpyruvate dioxygenase family protein n=1 Tax=Phaeovulum sp. TaxID=2934796 RepID=UPI003563869F
MQRCISSLSFSDPLAEKIRAAAEAGFEGIEIFREDIVGFDGTPEDIAALARNSGIAITSLQSLRDWEASPEDRSTWCDTQAARFLDLAARLGAPLLVVCANTRADALADPARAAADLARLADMAAARGLKLGYEALVTSTHVKTYADAWEIVQRAARPNLGLVVNAIHTFAADAGLAGLAQIDMERVFLVHLADAPTTRIDPRLMTESFRLLPGQGNLPVAELYADLLARGYAGPMSMEIFNDQLRALEPALIARDAMRAYDLLEDRMAADGVARSAVERVAFIELVCGGQEADALAALLGAMGFAKTHAGAALSAYQQGEITILLNRAEKGLAHSLYLMQGLGVASLGLQVSQMAPFAKAVEPGAKAGGHDLPLVRGPGGSAFYLLDRPLDQTALFRRALTVVKGAEAGGQLTHIDHFAQALVPNLFLSALLFYRAIFDFRSESQRDVLDPHGTVHSRVVANDDGSVRLSLNSSLSAGTSTTRFLEKAGYAAWHHFAFATTDIFAVAASLPQAQLLQIPPNYYDDLYLRFDLPEALVERMRGLNILYDRDGAGEYFQLYTRAINGLFFEVVQREGYAGLGAPNAGVRMQAQSREYEAQHALDMF